MRYVLATANAHKAAEIAAVLIPLGIELVARPADLPDVVEDADTLEGNALLKATAVAAATGIAAVADDTGLFVDALDGRPGVYSARYAGEGATNERNVDKVLAELADVPDEARAAHFRTVIAVAEPGGATWTVDGVLAGRILRERRGEHGFGYDPIFAPDSAGGRSLAELSPDEKNECSHRGVALRAFAARAEGVRGVGSPPVG